MLINYIKIAFRNIVRHKLYSIINIMGLAIGMACAILLLLFVRDELSYDKYNSKHERIYLVKSHLRTENSDGVYLGSSFPIGPALKDEYPAIEESVRSFFPGEIYFIDQKKEFIGEDAICYADPAIFKVFDHKFIYGSAEGALDDIKSIVLSEALARKYFGDQNPVGKTLSRNNGVDYIVKGVFKDLPHNTFRRYTALISIYSLQAERNESRNQINEDDIMDIDSRESCALINSNSNILTYILLNENARVDSIIEDYERFRKKYVADCGNRLGADFEPVFQPLADVYLHLKQAPLFRPVILIRIYVLSSLALLILIIACINYMNLATARSAGRTREVGVRKVLGAARTSLIRQFLIESMVITIAALLVALVLIELFLPSFNNLIGKELTFGVIAEPDVFTGLLIVALVVGLIAGSYPAFFLSSLIPANVIKGDTQLGKGRGRLRKLLVVIQFSITIIVIISTLLIKKQIDFMQSMDLGFNKNDILVITSRDPEVMESIPVFKNEILGNSEISVVARSNNTAGMGNWATIFTVEDLKGEIVRKPFSYVMVDFDFIDLMGMKVLEGRSFSREMGTDQMKAILVNETLVKEMGWTDSPIGKRFEWGIDDHARDAKVIGVLKDFHFQSLQTRLMPMVIMLGENEGIDLPIVSIKISPTNSEATVDFIKEKWHKLNPMQPFEYIFLEDIIRDQYQNEDNLGRIFNYSAFLSILISCLGLFGLSSFIAEKRTKEIGVRKVHGASIWNILFLLAYDYIKLLIVSSIIAWLITIYALVTLSDVSPYKPEDFPWGLIIAVCIAMAIALATVSYHAIKASLTDPVKALRYE